MSILIPRCYGGIYMRCKSACLLQPPSLVVANPNIHSWLLTVAEFCRTQLRDTEAGAKYSAMVSQACDESRQGAAIQLGRLAFIAKLPA